MYGVEKIDHRLTHHTWFIAPLLRTLTEGVPLTMQELVEKTGVARRSIVDLLSSFGLHSEGNRTRYVLSEREIEEIQERLAVLDQGRASAHRRAYEYVVDAVSSWLQSIPAPRKNLDHVQAVPETILDRTRFLIENFDVTSTRFLFLGDHDLTAPALALAAPAAHIVVADVDNELLDYQVDLMERVGASNASLVFSDFRVGLPPALVGSSDVVVTDPPYSAEGMALFVRRGIEALDPSAPDTRLVVAYAHSRLRPDLGNRVQRAILRTDVVIDRLHPGFNKYSGAEALGSQSDLYVLQPTSLSLKRAGKDVTSARIYTHGKDSQESVAQTAADGVLSGLVAWLGSGEFDLVSGIDGSEELVPFASNHIPIRDLAQKPPKVLTRRIVIDARGIAHDALWHYVLAIGLFRIDSFLVIFDRRERVSNWTTALADVLKLCGRNETIDQVSSHAIGVKLGEKTPVSTWEFLVRKPHGSLRTAWRDAIVRASAARQRTTTKNEARGSVERQAPRGSLGRRLIDLPTCQLHAIAVRSS